MRKAMSEHTHEEKRNMRMQIDEDANRVAFLNGSQLLSATLCHSKWQKGISFYFISWEMISPLTDHKA